jgi:hypothetical protein
MDFYTKLPRSFKEFPLYIAVISVISVNIIAPLITCFEVGFNLDVWAGVYHVISFIWLTVVACVVITYKPAQWLTQKIIKKGDSFYAVITINILCNVFLMSILLTVFGTWVGTRKVSMEPILHFFYKWPRNFAISFAIESLIAQPIARRVMCIYHAKKDVEKEQA